MASIPDCIYLIYTNSNIQLINIVQQNIAKFNHLSILCKFCIVIDLWTFISYGCYSYITWAHLVLITIIIDTDSVINHDIELTNQLITHELIKLS